MITLFDLSILVSLIKAIKSYIFYLLSCFWAWFLIIKYLLQKKLYLIGGFKCSMIHIIESYTLHWEVGFFVNL